MRIPGTRLHLVDSISNQQPKLLPNLDCVLDTPSACQFRYFTVQHA